MSNTVYRLSAAAADAEKLAHFMGRATEQIDLLGDQVYAWVDNDLQTSNSAGPNAGHLQAGEPIVKEWIRDAVTVHGPAIHSLRNRIAHEAMPTMTPEPGRT